MINNEFVDRDGPILVHCSAGVGRTGTYIAVFKLWLDVKDPNVTKLSIKDTVLELRKQRCLMVQKKEQYVYIARCLRYDRLKELKEEYNVLLQLYRQFRRGTIPLIDQSNDY